MKKPIIISSLLLTLLTGCSAPNYGETLNKKDQTEPVKEDITGNTDVLSFNGYIVEVSDDNVIKVRVPKAGQLVESGLQVNDDEIIQVALAAVEMPLSNIPFSKEANTVIQALLPEGHEIQVDAILPPANQNDSLDAASIIEGFVYFDETEKNSIQSVLIQNGLALLDSSEIPYLSESDVNFKELQEKAQNGELGVWAIDGLITLSKIAEAEFTKAAEFNEQQAQGILDEFKARGWTVQEILKQYGVTIE